MIRLRLEIDKDVYDYFQNLARTEGVNFAELLRRGISVLKVYQERKKLRATHLGFVSDPSKLDVEIKGILTGM